MNDEHCAGISAWADFSNQRQRDESRSRRTYARSGGYVAQRPPLALRQGKHDWQPDQAPTVGFRRLPTPICRACGATDGGGEAAGRGVGRRIWLPVTAPLTQGQGLLCGSPQLKLLYLNL